eukprot:Gb_22753 [translate_table: standard]
MAGRLVTVAETRSQNIWSCASLIVLGILSKRECGGTKPGGHAKMVSLEPCFVESPGTCRCVVTSKSECCPEEIDRIMFVGGSDSKWPPVKLCLRNSWLSRALVLRFVGMPYVGLWRCQSHTSFSRAVDRTWAAIAPQWWSEFSWACSAMEPLFESA